MSRPDPIKLTPGGAIPRLKRRAASASIIVFQGLTPGGARVGQSSGVFDCAIRRNFQLGLGVCLLPRAAYIGRSS